MSEFKTDDEKVREVYYYHLEKLPSSQEEANEHVNGCIYCKEFLIRNALWQKRKPEPVVRPGF